MFFCNHYKNDSSVWSCFKSREEMEVYMSIVGGVFTIREGDKFNPQWIKEEETNRSLEY